MPTFIKLSLKKLIDLFQSMVLPLCSKTAFLSSFFYTFFSRDFYYEHQAILKARLKYHRCKGLHGASSALLRRNIHRLEKGLIMRPRRSVFALDYITETVDAFVRASKKTEFNPSELQWASDVLNEYFNVVEHNEPRIKNSFAAFSLVFKEICKDKKPYQQRAKVHHDVSYKQLYALAQSRCSTRWFNQQSVELDKIKSAALVASQAPSACNRQPYQFHVINEQPFLQTLSRLPGGTAGFADNIPCLIAVVGDQSYYPFARDRHVIYIDGSLASMQFMLALETLGLSSCPINWPELYSLDKQVAKLLDLPQYKRVVMFIAVGYADETGQIPFSDKKAANDLVIETNAKHI
ncbi:nitroreductase family protein [Pseudoalteromonas mariniglutinosa]|uniref:nitroreductase family protein n=1 Tax=Pseudoalteromonas mariniglutinosa TaxID=206042 RepID=UPI00384C09C9